MRRCKHLHRRVTKEYLCCAEKNCMRKIRKLTGHEQYGLVQIGFKTVEQTPERMHSYTEEAHKDSYSIEMRAILAVNRAKELIAQYS